MPQIDQFESVFRSALRDVFEYCPISVRSILLITDRSTDDIASYLADLQRFLSTLGDDVKWTILNDDVRYTTADLLARVEKAQPDLICTYRNLHSKAWQFPHSLGEHLDVLVQKSRVPVMILPHPDADYAHDHAMEHTARVMVMTDHLANAHDLVNHAVGFATKDATLFLSHIEDRHTFEHYMEAISKIPEIDTDLAREKIQKQLLKDPSDYVASCARVLKEHGLALEVETLVRFGQNLSEYRTYIEDDKIDLLVMSARDDRQQAMHGPAYPLAIELRQIPLLLL